MTLEQIEYEIQKIIKNMKDAIAEEEKSIAKTANYELYKERLKTALELQAEIGEAKKQMSHEMLLKRFLNVIYGK